MKRKAWELAPLFIAAAVAFGWAVGRVRRPAAAEAPPIPAAAVPRASTGIGDPTRPEDFLPDRASKPDPNAPPDPSAPPDPRASADPKAGVDPTVPPDPTSTPDRTAPADPSVPRDEK